MRAAARQFTSRANGSSDPVTASRFARDILVQETGWRFLMERGIDLAQVPQHGEGLLALLDNGLERDHDLTGIVACSSSGDDLGLVMSAMTNFDKPASSRTVSVKSFVSGLSKLKTMGT
jgi:hypothetical protein